MLKRKNKNGGMTLVEVIVSMLVLSIAVVTVMTTFSMASKTNRGTKQKQSIESLMENLLEYAQAGGSDYKTWFHVDTANYTMEQSFAPGVTKQIELLSNIPQGYFKYSVRVTTDTAPAEYESTHLNDRGVIQFGGSGSNTILIDASLKSTDTDNFGAGDGISDYDNAAYDYFYTLHEGAVTAHNLEEEQTKAEIEEAGGTYSYTPWETVTMDVLWAHVDRELWLQTVSLPDNKMQLLANMVYEFDGGLFYPDGVSKRYEIPLYISGEYDTASSTVEPPMRLNQIYVLYSDATEEPDGYKNGAGTSKDVRILDAGDTLDANFFFVEQDVSIQNLSDVVGATSLSSRVPLTAKIAVSMYNPLSAHQEAPKRADIYCSCDVNLDGEGSIPNTTCHDYTLVPKVDEVRVATVTFEILEVDATGAETVLAKETVTRLQ